MALARDADHVVSTGLGIIKVVIAERSWMAVRVTPWVSVIVTADIAEPAAVRRRDPGRPR